MKDVFFTLDDIKDFLKQEFDLNWTGKFMIKFSTKEFIDASIDHFLPHGYRPLFLLKTNDNKKVIAAIDIGNWSFILDNKKTGEEIDKSEKWENFVFLRHVKSDYIKENKSTMSKIQPIIDRCKEDGVRPTEVTDMKLAKELYEMIK